MILSPVSDADLDRAFAALADPVRRAIIARLSRGAATVNELAEPFAISKQAVSKHSQVLELAWLVTRTRAAQRRPVHVEAARLEAMTVSFVMAVTMPRIRLRADAPPMVPTAAGCASSWATAASWAPSTVRRPASSVDPSRRPESTMRRTVSSETPRREAASVIRRCGMTVTLHPHLRTWSACVCRVRDSTAPARWVGREARRKGG